MIAARLAGLLTRPFAPRVIGFALAALAVALFLFNLRRAGEKAGRAAERLDARDRTDAICREMLDATVRRPHDRSALAERLRDGRY